MKKYKIYVMHPGMSMQGWTVYANNFHVEDGVYFFYEDDELLNTFPVGITIIDNVSDVDEVD
jgi:hypothetical protein